ncbi:F0F1 ATP synthase subunit gamma [Actibacterium sp. MT2.3-13A]|uniref:F0F1 ATP synthase subunit gamma n=1 Tax=Actibacterium sp. MT2.3-13A TaxID=2828332 RepID=UPI001BA68273|nr:F0F1 ATP synthase subunit gamma [Actibacterium sp. MT2.3-13A]
MEHLAKVQARLTSLTELHDLVGALRSMTANQAKEAQQAFDGTESYARAIEHAIAGAAQLAGQGGRAAFGTPGTGRPVLIAICAEHGFVGGFDVEILTRAQAIRAPGEALVVVGSRGMGRAQEMRIRFQRSHRMTTRVAGVPALAHSICKDLETASSARIVLALPRAGARFAVTERTILPLSARLLEVETPPEPPLHHLAPAALLRRLASEYLFAEVARALMESLASESNARVRTMDAAAHNIDDRLEKLQRELRRIRQEEITADLLDVVTGAEAVMDEAGPHAGGEGEV